MQNALGISRQLVSFSDVNKIKFISASVDSQKLNASALIPAYLLTLNVGSALLSQHKKDRYISSAQLVHNYGESDLVGESLVVVVNFPRKQIGQFKSDCLVVGLQNEFLNMGEKIKSTVAVKTSEPVADGSVISISNKEEVLTENTRDLTFSEFMRVDIRVGTVLSIEPDADASNQLLRVDCGPVGEKIATTGWTAISEDIIRKQILLVTNVSPEDIPSGTRTDSLILSPKQGIWCMPATNCENGYRLA